MRKTVLAASLCLAVWTGGCGGDGDEPSAVATSQATTVPERPTGPTVEAVLSAAVPEGYQQEPLPSDVEQTVRENIERDETVREALAEFQGRRITKGSVPVATVLVMRFAEDLSTADRAGVARGFAEAGGEPKTISLGDKDGTEYSGAGVTTILYVTDEMALFVIGEDRPEAIKVATAAVGVLP